MLNASPDRVSVVIVDDEPEFRARFARAFEGHPVYQVEAVVGEGKAAIEAIERYRPSVLIVDLGLPDISGMEVIRTATRLQPDVDALVVTVFGDEDHVVQSLEAGATGYLLKDTSPEQLIECVDVLRAGGSPISPSIARRLLSRFRAPSSWSPTATSSKPSLVSGSTDAQSQQLLSDREHEILRLIAKGLSFFEVGDVLSISQHTVVTHVKRIYRKLAVHSRSEAVYEAGQLGLLR